MSYTTTHTPMLVSSGIAFKTRAVPTKNERVELEMKIMKYRLMSRRMAADPAESERIRGLVAELEKKLREIDE